jgi:hyperosmotically inducible protein
MKLSKEQRVDGKEHDDSADSVTRSPGSGLGAHFFQLGGGVQGTTAGDRLPRSTTREHCALFNRHETLKRFKRTAFHALRVYGAERKIACPRGIIVAVHKEARIMKTKFAITCMAFGALLGSTVVASAADPSYASQTTTFVKDSAITTMVKTKLASEHITSLEQIHVDTDTNGVVWLTGSARTQEAADKAVSVARDTDRVTAVHSDIKVKSSD